MIFLDSVAWILRLAQPQCPRPLSAGGCAVKISYWWLRDGLMGPCMSGLGGDEKQNHSFSRGEAAQDGIGLLSVNAELSPLLRHSRSWRGAAIGFFSIRTCLKMIKRTFHREETHEVSS